MDNLEYLKLMAEWMDQKRLMSTGQFDAEDEELEYWAMQAHESNGPVLELASGSGRVLIPLSERGFDISGVDNSDAMLERCRAMCRERNVAPPLYNQSVQELDIPRMFCLVFGNAGFLSLFTRDDDVRAALESVKRQLIPGGRFICTFEQPTEKTLKWRDKNYNWTGDYFRAPNGALYAHRSIHKDCSSTPNLWQCILVIEKYVDGRLIECEANQRAGRLFSVEEVLQFFEAAGFERAAAFNGCTADPPGKDVTTIAVVAHKPSR